MTKKEFKYIVAGMDYLTEEGRIDYGEVLSMIVLANELHKNECEREGCKSLAKALYDENKTIAKRWSETRSFKGADNR